MTEIIIPIMNAKKKKEVFTEDLSIPRRKYKEVTPPKVLPRRNDN